MTNKRAVFTGSMNIDGIKVPVKIYSMIDVFGIEGHRYHVGCNGKIRELLYCEDHPGLESPEIFSGVQIGEQIVRVDSELKKSLLDRDAPFVVQEAFKLNALGAFMSDGSLVPMAMYEVAPDIPLHPIASPSQNALVTILERMRVKKVFLSCTIPLGGMNRPAILLPGGQLYILAYAEEMRDYTFYYGEQDKQLAAVVDTIIDSRLNAEFVPLSLETYRKKVARFFSKALKPVISRPKTSRKKAEGVKVNA